MYSSVFPSEVDAHVYRSEIGHVIVKGLSSSTYEVLVFDSDDGSFRLQGSFPFCLSI
jgi:hypothetical protein